MSQCQGLQGHGKLNLEKLRTTVQSTPSPKVKDSWSWLHSQDNHGRVKARLWWTDSGSLSLQSLNAAVVHQK